ncbi:MAG: DUF4397 domain-containing protein [Deltaproteobacteria bacterium]|nr:DUF4397 domain-containing protein [Deltaproteobacteria bacterium]
MQNFIRTLGVLSLLSLVLFGCGGGGGGGSRSGSKGVRVLHASVDSAPFLLSTSAKEGEVLQTSKFSFADRYFALPGGEQIVSASSAVGAPVFAFTVPEDRPERQTILVYGSRTKSGVKAALLSDEWKDVPPDMSALRFVHGVEGVRSIDAAVGSVSVGQGVSVGSASLYVTVPAGPQQIVVRQSGSSSALYTATVDLLPGRAYSLLAAGEHGYFMMVRLVED